MTRFIGETEFVGLPFAEERRTVARELARMADTMRLIPSLGGNIPPEHINFLNSFAGAIETDILENLHNPDISSITRPLGEAQTISASDRSVRIPRTSGANSVIGKTELALAIHKNGRKITTVQFKENDIDRPPTIVFDITPAQTNPGAAAVLSFVDPRTSLEGEYQIQIGST